MFSSPLSRWALSVPSFSVEALLPLEMDLSRVEDGVDVLALGRDLGDVDDEHGWVGRSNR